MKLPNRSKQQLYPQLDLLASLGDETQRPSIESAGSNLQCLPGVPGDLISKIFAAAPGNEIETGKFAHPESSAALAANTFGIFLEKASDFPPIPGCEARWSRTKSIQLETTLHLPWKNGRHPCLDVLVVTETTVFAIESKRYEPYRDRQSASVSTAYWRPVWGDQMDGYEFVRDIVSDSPSLFSRLNAGQLIKHALGLRTAVNCNPKYRNKRPVLVYLYAEPEKWPDGHPVSKAALSRHRKELRRFSRCTSDCEITFISMSYQTLLSTWARAQSARVRAHAKRLVRSFAV